MNVLSLFDGMSCGQIALKTLGTDVGVFYASEVDKYAIKQTQHVFPNTVQLGDVTKWREWDIDWSKIDLLMGGSPCQGFSFAGKQLAFDDPRSALFFVFVEIWNHIKSANPNAYFLLENVKMKKEFEIIISKYMGVAPIEINSALISAQNRVRLYWTNIANEPYGLFGDMQCVIPQPKDKGILLKDILEDDVPEKYYLSEKMLEPRYDGKTNCLTSVQKDKLIMQLNPSTESGGKQPYQQNRIYDINGISPALCANKADLLIPEATKKGYTEIKPGDCFDFENPKSETRRGRKMEDKSNCLMAKETDFMQFTYEGKIRRLTPTECARLQTVPDWYEWISSDTQIYRMLGNGWTVDVIAHILSYGEWL